VEGAANAASVMTSATRISNYCSGWDQECYLPGAWTLTHLTAPRSSCSLRRRCPLEVSLHLQGRPAAAFGRPRPAIVRGTTSLLTSLLPGVRSYGQTSLAIGAIWISMPGGLRRRSPRTRPEGGEIVALLGFGNGCGCHDSARVSGIRHLYGRVSPRNRLTGERGCAEGTNALSE
jgi:hypothetical protein